MKYPHLPPVGAAGAGQAWEVAGTDLRSAELELETEARATPHSREGWLKLAEVLRRRGDLSSATVAAERAIAAGPAGELEVDAWLAAANVAWSGGDPQRADRYAARAVELANRNGDAADVASGLARARAFRIRENWDGRRIAEEALRRAASLGDPDLEADAQRELAAWLLLRGDSDDALPHAQRALEIHTATGDRFLKVLADLLIARCQRDDAGDGRNAAVHRLRRAAQEASTLGSEEAEVTVKVWLAQTLQRAATVGDADWDEAETILVQLLDSERLGFDLFTRAEVLLPLAKLWTSAGRFDEAERAIDEYESIYRMWNNPLGIGNAYKARARLGLARAGIVGPLAFPLRAKTVAALPQAVRLFWSARRAYRVAEFPAGVESIDLDVATLRLVAGRRPGPSLTHLRRDPISEVMRLLHDGQAQLRAQRTEQAEAAFRSALAQAQRLGRAALVAAAAERLASTEAQLGRSDAAEHVRLAVQSMEQIRSADSAVRPVVSRQLRPVYEAAALLAAGLDEAALTLEFLERLRTERLVALMRSSDRRELSPPLREVLERLDAVNAELEGRHLEPPTGGATRAARAPDLLTKPVHELIELREALRGELADLTSTEFADLYDPDPGHVTGALAKLTTLFDVLALVPTVDATEPAIISAWSGPGGTGVCVTPFDASLERLRSTLSRSNDDLRLDLTSDDLSPIASCLPPALLHQLRKATTPRRLTIIPAGWLWAVPFNALPIDSHGTLLVEKSSVYLAPSAAVLNELRPDDRPTIPAPLVSWTEPDLDGSDTAALRGLPNHVALGRRDLVRDVFTTGGHRYGTAVLTSHGNTERGLAHAACTTTGAVILRAADFIMSEGLAPHRIVFASCHGAFNPGHDDHEPLGLPLAALCRGSYQCIGSHFEALQGPRFAETLSHLYRHLAEGGDAGEALANTLRTALRETPELRTHPLAEWAVLSLIGTPC